MSHRVPEEELRTILDEAHLRTMVKLLPDYERCDTGLCVDRAPVRALRMEGRSRLSVLRLYSKTAGRAQLVGQVQVLAAGRERGSWSVQYYAHDAHIPVAREVSDRKRWWEMVLANHLEASGLLNRGM